MKNKLLNRIRKKIRPSKKSLEIQDMTLLLFIILIVVTFFYIFYQQMEFFARYWEYLVDFENFKLYAFLLIFPLSILIKIQLERRKKQRKFKFLPSSISKRKKKKK